MSQVIALVDALKAEMRRQKRTYAEAAEVLALSEPSIKRLFAERSFTLERLDALCRWLGMEISELVQRMEAAQVRVSELSAEQERELVSDVKLLLVAHCLLNRWEVPQIIDTFIIDEHEAIQLLARLDRMGVIQLLPGNRVRLMISRNFHWRPNGPIQQFFESHVQQEFFHSRFDRPGEARLFVSGMLSRRSNEAIQRRLEKLAMEFNLLHREDESLPLDQRFGTSLVLAMRPWEAEVFASLRRGPNKKTF